MLNTVRSEKECIDRATGKVQRPDVFLATKSRSSAVKFSSVSKYTGQERFKVKLISNDGHFVRDIFLCQIRIILTLSRRERGSIDLLDAFCHLYAAVASVLAAKLMIHGQRLGLGRQSIRQRRALLCQKNNDFQL